MSTVTHLVADRMESTTHASAAESSSPPALLDEESRVWLRDLRSETNRGALYKTLHDARCNLRKHLDAQDLSVDALLEEAH